ncbi:hypothetical protein KA977_13695 [Candidatus Dependentiae bacterium]|nr:hypothetical protein [Candidatus Dependentiae bacterium]
MLKKVLIILIVLSLGLIPAMAADAPAKASKKSASKKAGDWDVSMSLVDAVTAAKSAVSQQYPDAAAYNAALKFSKSGKASYDIKFKISDVEDIKVTVAVDDGKCKVAKKTGKVSKTSVKDKESMPSKSSKGKGGKKNKKAAEEEEELSEE